MKRLFWVFFGSLGLVVLVGIVVAVRQPKPIVSAPLTLPDGTVVRIMGVTYGTKHFLGRPLARFVAHVPAGVQVVLKRLLGSQAVLQASTTTFEPRLIVWLGHTTNNATALAGSGYINAFLSDSSGFLSGDNASVYGWWSNPQDLQFQVFPRRDPVLVLYFFDHSATGGVTMCGSLPFANPFRGKFPQWQPEPLPATRRAGDVAVTLDKLSTGHDQNITQKSLQDGGRAIEFTTNRVDGQNRTVCAIHLHALAGTNEVWQVASEEVSDATGNRARNTSIGWGSSEDGYFTFAPGLWTNEPAWKLHCEIKRAKGFGPGETFVFRDVPLGRLDETNRLGCTTNFRGATVALVEVVRRAPSTNNTWSSEQLSQAHFTTAGLTNDLHLDLLSARTDSGTSLDSPSWSSGGAERTYSFRNIPREAKTADFTFAVQRSRWVEFVVKPEVGPFSLEYGPEPKAE
jgi:hypothetical protein